MNVTVASRPRALSDRPRVQLGGEIVCYDPEAQELHHLNATASRVFLACDGTRTIANLSEDLARTERVPRDVIETHVLSLVRELVERGLCAV